MFKIMLMTQEVLNYSNEREYNCTKCHESAGVNDYELIKIGINLNEVAQKIEFLSKCRHCYKFLKQKGSKTITEFYAEMNENILL